MPKFTNALLDKAVIRTMGALPFQLGDLRELITILGGIIKYLSPLKLSNLLLRELERLSRAATPKGFPFHAIIDSVNACNLQCRGCLTGRSRRSGRNKQLIDLDLLVSFLKDIGKYVVIADLFNWGEPLLHLNIVNIVKIIHDRRIFQQISTNLNIPNPRILEKICDAGLDFLIVSISGVTQETYRKYHRKGDIELVVDNLRKIVNYKKKRKYNYPIIELKYLLFKHNTHQIEAARILAKEIGVDIFRPCYAGGPEEENPGAQRRKKKLLYPDTGKLCSQLWRTIVLNADGGIAPCCFLYFKQDDFAEYHPSQNRNIQGILSNPEYVAARSMFNRAAVGTLPEDLQHPCLKCAFVHRQPHLTGYLAANPNAKQAHRTGGP